ncbi:MAG: 3',5'-cyclic-nucleotide phosphodiesterase [Acidobacteria bacterium]|nr:3',5'-cyclic-nucleotide phosphodiesterase [Acidobacteriota bacterium]
MKLEILGSYGGNANFYKLTSFLIDDFLALDAGCLTTALNLDRQYQVTDIVISHSHMDHTGSLPYLIDNQFGLTESPLRIWSSPFVLDALRQHIFNDVIWPDFTKLPNESQPCMTLEPMSPLETIHIRHLRITPIPVNHIVPCCAFLVESTLSGAAILYTADTTNTDQIWEIANQKENLKGVIVDCSFPNNMTDLAIASGHMTPQLLAKDLKKLKRPCKIMIYHLKPSFDGKMTQELDDLGLELDYDIQGKVFEFTST